MATTQDFLKRFQDLNAEAIAATDRYVDDLLAQAQGDYDFAIKQLKRNHEIALGTDDQARATFMEEVADKLEERIGRIPYDYEVGTTRLEEDFSRIEDVTTRNKNLALNRLAEDEKVWREQFGEDTAEARQAQGEELLQRGILSGTREDAQGIATRDINRLEGSIDDTLSAYERALGRTREDINTQAEDTMFEATRGLTRGKEDLKTTARRGAIDEEDKLAFGSEAAQRQLDAQKKELERLREKEKRMAQQSSITMGSYA